MKNDDILNFEQASPLFEEYDKIFVSYQKQFEIYKNEHDVLKIQINKLIHENKALRVSVEESFEANTKNLPSSNFEINDRNIVVDNLKSQLDITIQEKDSTYDLWQNSLKIIDHLESELQLYKCSKDGFISKIELDKEKQKFETEMKELQKQLKLLRNKQNDKQKTLIQIIEQKSNDFANALEGQKTALNKIQEKDTEITELTIRINNLSQVCDQLKNEIEKRDTAIKNLSYIDQNSKAKVLESLLITEAAMAEKDASLNREAQAKEKIFELTTTLNNLVKETDEKMKNEFEIIKKQYNEKLNKLLDDMKTVQNKSNDKNIEFEQIKRENKYLETEISRLQKGNIIIDDNSTSKLLILEKNLEATFQKLLLSERRFFQINADKESIKVDMDQMIETFERDRKTYEIEKQTLERKIKLMQNELTTSNKCIMDCNKKIKELQNKIKDMENVIKEKIAAKDRLFEEILRNRINAVQNESKKIQNELASHLKSEHNLNQKWKSETKLILNKLQNRITQLKHENTKLNKKLEAQDEIFV